MRVMNMVKLLLLIYVLLNTFTHATEENKNDEEPSHNLITQILANIYTRANKNLKVPDECMVCYERFPVSLKLSCGHEFCAICVESVLCVCESKKCPKCRAPLSNRFSEFLLMINIYPSQLTPDIPIKKLQQAFPLICSVSNLTTLVKCVDMGIDVNTRGFCRYFPLHFASQKSVAKYLVNKGADVNQRGSGGNTPLHMCSQEGNLPVVQYLIENGANIIPVVQYLVENGAHLNQSSSGGWTSLFVSSQQGHIQVVKYLVENQANINQADNDDITPFFVSCQYGHLPVVEYLIENEADVNQATKIGATPLTFALYKNHTQIAKFLLRKGANIESTQEFLKNLELLDLIDILDKLCKEMEE